MATKQTATRPEQVLRTSFSETVAVQAEAVRLGWTNSKHYRRPDDVPVATEGE